MPLQLPGDLLFTESLPPTYPDRADQSSYAQARDDLTGVDRHV
jgi:hypothetical protein